MSTAQSAAAAAAPPVDDYLARQAAPPQPVELDPQYSSVRLVTPIGRLSYADNLAAPKPVNRNGPPKYTATLLMWPSSCTDIWRGICLVANAVWPAETVVNPQNPTEVLTVNGEWMLTYLNEKTGGLHNPLRNGDSEWAKAPQKMEAYRGLFALNTKADIERPPVFVDEDQRPLDPKAFYSGCYARMWVTLFAFRPRPGMPGKGIGCYLNGVQFARQGERLRGFDAARAANEAFTRAGAIPREAAPPAAPQQPGFGPNYGSPWGAPPAGFAAPPPGGAQQPQQAAYPAPQQPAYPAPQQPAYPPQQTAYPPQQPQQPAYPPQQPQQPAYSPQPNWQPPGTGGGQAA